MKNRLYIILSSMVALLLLASCDGTLQPAEESKYKKDNDAFLEKVAQDKQYTKLLFLNTSDPIYYKVIEQGSSKVYPYQDSTVKMVLSGRLISGEYFQEEGELSSKVSELIPGVQYALMSMNVGDKWEVVIPYTLGYGSYSRGYTLPGYSTLIFTIDLKEVTTL